MGDYLFDPQHVHTAPEMLHRVAKTLSFITQPREVLAGYLDTKEQHEWAESFADAVAFGWIEVGANGMEVTGRGQAALMSLDAAPRQMSGS